MKGRGHLPNVEKIGTVIVPKCADREKLNTMWLVNYHIKEEHGELV